MKKNSKCRFIMMYLIATPIGNLGDFSQRAIEVLQTVDYILCEDTRHSLPLLSHFNIKKPLKSYHKFNEASALDPIIEDLKSGKSIALISDAGTPGISDPGEILVERLVREDLKVNVIPGPCALINALVSSGLPTCPFQFVGFLPKAKGELETTLIELLRYKGTTVCYESPNRIKETLEAILTLAPARKLSLSRELTKKFEETITGTAEQILAKVLEKGEMVLCISGNVDKQDWSQLPVEDHVQYLQDTFGLSKNEAIKLAAKERGVPKRDVYNSLL